MIDTEKIFSIFMLSILMLFNSCEKKKAKEQEPNIVLFLVDDLGWKDLKNYGSVLYQTPHVDQLSKEGVVFSNAYAAATVCSPTRASILTGKYPATINTTDWIKGHHKPFARFLPPDWNMHLRDEDVTLAQALKEKGYTTIHIGKWHLGEEEKYWPEFYGFDKNIGGWRVGMPTKQKGIGGYFSPYHNPRLENGPEGEYLTERLTQEAAMYIETNKKKPFFLNFWLYNVHTPLQAKKAKIAKYENLVDSTQLQSNATYAAMVEHMDDALGAIVNQLKKAGVYENTIIVFASDNGGLIGNKGKELKPKITSNAPLRTGKGDIYEGGVRVPFMISWPNNIEPNRCVSYFARYISNTIRVD
jgi:arylsulfatase A